MRTALAVLVIISSGCGITTEVTRRVAFGTLPSAPLGLSGGSGVRFNVSTPTGDPQARGAGGSGMSFPMFQPDLGMTFKLGPRSFVGGRLAFASAAFGARGPPGILTAPSSSAAFEVGFGGGHDLAFSPLFGLSLSGEVGLTGVSVTTAGSFLETHPELMPAARLALGLYATPGDFRIYAGGTVGTSAMNDAISIRTVDCRTTCSTTETGRLSLSAMAMVGLGVRWQVDPAVSLGLEGWLPITEDGTRLPFMISLSVTVGDLTFPKPGVKPPLPPPPPPPEPEPIAPQL